jgi:hypothetical protein
MVKDALENQQGIGIYFTRWKASMSLGLNPLFQN